MLKIKVVVFYFLLGNSDDMLLSVLFVYYPEAIGLLIKAYIIETVYVKNSTLHGLQFELDLMFRDMETTQESHLFCSLYVGKAQ